MYKRLQPRLYIQAYRGYNPRRYELPEDMEIDLSELDDVFEEATQPDKGSKTMNHTILNNKEQALEFYDYLAEKVEDKPQIDNKGRKRIIIKGITSRGWNASMLINALLQKHGFTADDKKEVVISPLNPQNTNKVSSEISGISNALSELVGHRVYLGIYSSEKGYFKFYPEYVAETTE